MGFGISHQKAGLNWPGRHKAWSRERALANAWRAWTQRNSAPQRRGDAENGKGSGNGNGEHAKWRRITGITSAVEGVLTAKERKKGLKRLVERIENEIKNAELRIQNGTDRNGAPQRRGDAENGKGSGFRVQGIGNDERPMSLVTPFGRAVEEWAGRDEHSIESLCVNLQITRARLTMLTKEYCGMTAQELVDGFKIRRVKRGLVERLREAAQQLWGTPGSYAATKYEAPMDANNPHGQPTTNRGCPWPMDANNPHGQPTADRGCPWHTRGRSCHGRGRPCYYEDRASERARRCEELAARLRQEFDLEGWAVRAGFASGARLKRACLNVLGKSLRMVERALAAEVVRYYLCAEDKVLRQVASGEDSARVARARWAYNQSEDAPTEPFLDEWSKAEAFARDWLEAMKAGFG